jgi:gluconolactonase
MVNRRSFLRMVLGLSAASFLAACNAETPTATVQAPTQTAPTIRAARKVNLLADGLDFPEGPAFDPQGNLWCTELGAGNLILWKDGQVKRYPTNGKPNGLAFDHQGRAWVPDSGQNAVRRFDPASEKWETILDQIDGQALLTPNDISFDARGNVLFTCPNFADSDPNGYVVCLKPDRSAIKIARGLYRPNGLDITDGGKALVVGDTFQKKLFKGTWDDEKCTWNDFKAWADVGGSEGPDGMIPGADGLLYQAIFGDGILRVINATGETIEKIELPGKNPTNVAIDPSGKLGLVVTETEKGQLLSIPDIQPGVAIFDGGMAWG